MFSTPGRNLIGTNGESERESCGEGAIHGVNVVATPQPHEDAAATPLNHFS
jgi:hypothetical protein